MTQETQRVHTAFIKTQTPSYRMGDQVIHQYAKALGVSGQEACQRVNRQHSLSG